ncbi:endonuclease III [Anatilimnocola floriformis]|uniref:endonuclease III n=1 Tax=Anatilimnocola floriformis TaxID=2948575 RepID=UPI0020C2CAAE|nr:endonuclease III [Anatilimnocola floriformis]
MPAVAQTKVQASKVVKALALGYPDAECALIHDSPFQLLIATILSAQCTDERVNIVTKDLFAQCPTPQAIVDLPVKDLEKIIQSAGFYRMKAKNIKGCCQKLVDDHGGEVPQSLAELVELPGVGRKTANVVLGTSFGIPSGIVVDTHVTRLTNRLGLTDKQDAVKIETELMPIVPKQEWINFSHRLIHHGRRICKARKPLCNDCLMLKFCPQVGVDQIGEKKKDAE